MVHRLQLISWECGKINRLLPQAVYWRREGGGSPMTFSVFYVIPPIQICRYIPRKIGNCDIHWKIIIFKVSSCRYLSIRINCGQKFLKNIEGFFLIFMCNIGNNLSISKHGLVKMILEEEDLKICFFEGFFLLNCFLSSTYLLELDLCTRYR